MLKAFGHVIWMRQGQSAPVRAELLQFSLKPFAVSTQTKQKSFLQETKDVFGELRAGFFGYAGCKLDESAELVNRALHSPQDTIG